MTQRPVLQKSHADTAWLQNRSILMLCATSVIDLNCQYCVTAVVLRRVDAQRRQHS